MSTLLNFLARSRIFRVALAAALVATVIDALLQRRAAGLGPRPFRARIVIDAPIERVWAVVADIEGQPRWMHDMKTVEITTPPPTGVGTQGEATVRIFGIPMRDPVEVTAFEAPTTFAIRHDGLFSGTGVITLSDGADGTTTVVDWEERLVAPFAPYVWGLAAAPIMEGVFQADLERLRDLVEAG